MYRLPVETPQVQGPHFTVLRQKVFSHAAARRRRTGNVLPGYVGWKQGPAWIGDRGVHVGHGDAWSRPPRSPTRMRGAPASGPPRSGSSHADGPGSSPATRTGFDADSSGGPTRSGEKGSGEKGSGVAKNIFRATWFLL